MPSLGYYYTFSICVPRGTDTGLVFALYEGSDARLMCAIDGITDTHLVCL